MSQENFTAARAVEELSHVINRGGRQTDVADALGAEHGYLVNQIGHAVALGIVRKCRFALRSDPNEPVASCGQVNSPLANRSDQTPDQRDDHPYHDGELSCDLVRGALVALNANDWRESTSWVWRI